MRAILMKIDENIYSASIKNNKFKLITDSGSNAFIKYDKSSYWDWWKEKVGYYDEACDILTIYSDRIDIVSDIEQKTEKMWKADELDTLFFELQEFGIILKFINYDDENQILKIEVDGEIREFGSNKRIEFVKKDVVNKKTTTNAVKKEKFIVPTPRGSLVEYFKKKTEEYKRN